MQRPQIPGNHGMTLPKTVRAIFAPALALAAVLAGCLLDGKEARRGSVVENEVLAGVLYTQAGDPAPGATVRVYAVNYVPRGGLVKRADSALIYSAVTDDEGRYTLDSLPPGEYNILSEKDGARSYQDSLILTAGTDSIPSDTLRTAGSITAVVQLEPNHDPRTVTVQVLGTDRFTTADAAGRFTFGQMAQGTYTVRILTTLPEYTPYFGSLTVRSGMNDTLPGRIRLVYTGIPVVGGLGVTYDTVRSMASLSWDSVEYGFLKEYLVFRNDASSLTLPTEPIARVIGTTFQDDLSRFIPSDTAAAPKEFEYRVRARNLTDEDGLAFRSVRVTAAPRRMVVTTLNFRYARPDQRAGIGDTVLLPLDWSNPTRDCDSLEWYLGAGSALARAIRVQGRSGKDSLSIPLPQEPGHYLVQVRMRNASGHWWSNSMAVKVEADLPVADAGRDTTVTIRDSIVLKGRGRDEFGRIASLEWDIGAKGVFSPSASGDTVILAPAVPGAQRHVFRVRDDDGNVRLDTLAVTIVNDFPTLTLVWEHNRLSKGGGYLINVQARDFGRLRFHWDVGGSGAWIPGEYSRLIPSAQVARGKMLVRVRATDDDGNEVIREAEIEASKWSLVDSVVAPPRFGITATAIDGKLYSTGYGADRDEPFQGTGGTLSMYDPATGAWTMLERMPEPATYPSLGSFRGMLFAFGGGMQQARSVQVFDPATESWSLRKRMPVDNIGHSMAVELDGKIHLVAGEGRPQRLDTYDPATDSWSRKADIPIRHSGFPDSSYRINHPCAVLLDGRIHVVEIHLHWAYEPGTDSWVPRAVAPSPLWNPSAVVIGGKMYVISNSQTWEYDPAVDSWTQKSSPFAQVREKTIAAIGNRIFALSEEIDGITRRSVVRLLAYDPSDDP